MFGPTETMQFRIDVQDADHAPADLTVTADLSGAFGGTGAEALAYNAVSGLWELDYLGPRTMIPTGGTGTVLITATDSAGASSSQLFDVQAENWVGLAGSDIGDGISTSLGWTLGAACATDSAGRIYVAYSSRVNVPGGWQYAVYVKRYDPGTGTWSGLGGSDSGFGLNLNTQGRLIRSGYVRAMAYYSETHQSANKQCIYVLFDGNPDPDDGDNHWDSFLYRWNITDNQWEALGTGTDASDWITATPTVGVMDVGGFTRFGNRAQEAFIAFDPATDDVYVAWHGQINSSGSNKYAVFVSRFSRTAGTWGDFSGATPADGISDDHATDFKYPKLIHHGGKLYLTYQSGSSAGNILIRQGDLTTGDWSAATTLYDSAAAPGAAYPAIVADAAGNLYVGWKVTQSSPTDQEVHVVTATTANWSNPGSWAGANSGPTRISIPGNTQTSVIRLQLACDSSGNVYACWNQVHPGSTDTSKRNVFLAMFDGSVWRGLRGSLSGDGLSNYGTETHWLPALALDAQGRPVAAYDTYWGPAGGSANDRRKIYVKVLR